MPHRDRRGPRHGWASHRRGIAKAWRGGGRVWRGRERAFWSGRRVLVMVTLVKTIISPDPAVRNQALDAVAAKLSMGELLGECAELDAFRRRSESLYERVRALFFLYAIHRFHLPSKAEQASRPPRSGHGLIPFKGYEQLLRRRFEEAIDNFLSAQQADGPSDAISSALAAAYHRLAFNTPVARISHGVLSVSNKTPRLRTCS